MLTAQWVLSVWTFVSINSKYSPVTPEYGISETICLDIKPPELLVSFLVFIFVLLCFESTSILCQPFSSDFAFSFSDPPATASGMRHHNQLFYLGSFSEAGEVVLAIECFPSRHKA